MAYRGVLFRRDRLFGDSLVSKGKGAKRVGMNDGCMANGLVEVENQKDSGRMTGILEAISTGVQTPPVASNKVLSEILVPN